MEKELLLRCEQICKSFGPTKALDNVNLTVSRGEIRGLIGENGSGKSTIASIIAGVQPCDSGTIYWKGEVFNPKNTVDAQEKGVAMIVQESATVGAISVAANIFLNKEERFRVGPFINSKKMNEAASEILKKVGAEDIDPSMLTQELNFEKRKTVEIARCLNDEPDLLIVDETTTAISHEGRDTIYRVMREMANSGKAVLFISHDLDELVSICTDVTILRDGQLVTNLEKDQMNQNTMRTYMVGRVLSDNYYRSDYDGSYARDVVLKIRNVSNGVLENFSADVHKGEILGIGGLSEAGMHELGRALYGADKVLTGTVEYIGKGFINNVENAIEYGVAYVSKNRDAESLIQNDTIKKNIVLPAIPRLEKGMYVSPKSENDHADMGIESMRIKCEGRDQMVNQLSGGNKQKVVFAKWTQINADALILDCPTRGVDVGVKASMYQLIYDLKKQGKAIVMISEELPELIGMSDEIIVLKDGKISKTYSRSENLKETDIIQYMI